MSKPDQTFRVDGVAVALVSVVIFGLVPFAFGWAGWRLVAGARWVGAAATFGIAAIIVVGAVRELAGALGTRVSPEGIHRRGSVVRWSDVESAREPEYGVLVLDTPRGPLRLRTYLFTDGRKLTQFILAQVESKRRPEDSPGS